MLITLYGAVIVRTTMKLLEKFLDNNLVVINDGRPTRYQEILAVSGMLWTDIH